MRNQRYEAKFGVFIIAYAPVMEKMGEERETFYESVNECVVLSSYKEYYCGGGMNNPVTEQWKIPQGNLERHKWWEWKLTD